MTLAELTAAGFDVSPTACARLERFVALLLEENQKVNLTATRDASALWATHVCDSLALLAPLREAGGTRLLDLGTGGGLPGIPVACALPDVTATLLDSTQKKVAAVQRIIAELPLTNARTVAGRAETLAHEAAFRERFDAVASRAVAKLPVLLEYAAGFVEVGGRAYFYKSTSAADEERAAAESAARQCALTYERTLSYDLPGDAGQRVLLIYRKTATLRRNLPRLPGQAKKQPL